MKDYQSLSHTKWDCKYRRFVLEVEAGRAVVNFQCLKDVIHHGHVRIGPSWGFSATC